MSVSRPPLNKNMAARQAGVFVVVVLGLGAQLALLRHELSQGHRWHANTLIFSQVGSVLMGLLSVRWIYSRDLGAALSGVIGLCFLLRLVPAAFYGMPLEISDFMLYLMLVSVATSGLTWQVSLPLSATALGVLFGVNHIGGHDNLEGLVYSGFLTALMLFLSVFNLRAERQQVMMQDITQLALRDDLTGLANRRAVYLRLRELMLARETVPDSETGAASGGVALLDLDHFKQVNDTRGHDAGDRLLQEVARLLEDYVSGFGLAGRWGGEEFIVLMENVSHAEATGYLEGLLQSIRDSSFADAPNLTVSAGFAGLDEGQTPEQVVKLADERLYAAKRAGRNRLVFSS